METLTGDLAKFTKGKETLDKLLGNQRFGKKKVSLGFDKLENPFPKYNFQDAFVTKPFEYETNSISQAKINQSADETKTFFNGICFLCHESGYRAHGFSYSNRKLRVKKV